VAAFVSSHVNRVSNVQVLVSDCFNLTVLVCAANSPEVRCLIIHEQKSIGLITFVKLSGRFNVRIS